MEIIRGFLKVVFIMADRVAKARNGFVVRLAILGVALFLVYQVLIYFFGEQPPAGTAEIGDFADRRIDRFYQQGDTAPLPGTELPPLPETEAPN